MTNSNWRDPQNISIQHQPEKGGGKITFNTDKPHRRKRKIPRKIVKAAILIGILAILLIGIIGVGAVAWISRDLPSADGVLKRSVTVSTKIYDRKGETVLYDIHGNIKRTLITLDQVPDLTKKAVLTAEDRNFYQHAGFSVTGIIRSAIIDIFTGKRVGGSTLTQQFVKNAILTNEKTYTRKIKELIISYQIEQKFTKDQIFNMYLNEIPYGSVIYGIEAASQSFFGKPAKDLTLAESAIIAAIPQMPTYYSPYGSHKAELLARQRYILDSMAELGHISKDQAEAAKTEKIIFSPMRESIIAPHFVMYIKELLSEKYGENFISQEGLKVYTTLDLDKQKIAEEAVKLGVEANGKKYEFGNASLISLDPKTGQILAMVGSADYFNEDIDGQVNVAISPRQPGSSFKPIVYTASFIKGYTPDTILYDTLTNFDTTGAKKYEPHNYHNNENGPVTLRKALAGSLNIPAVKLTYLTGMENILDLADKLGYTTLADRTRFGLSIVLGGAEVKLLDHTNSYGTLSQEGTKHEVNSILKIEDKNGKVIEEYKDKTESVMDPEIARQTTDILSDDSARAYIFGAGGKLTLPGRPVAAKTGTTNDYHDAWAMGYTPSLVCGVWVGNSNNDAMKMGADGSIIAAPIWNYYMTNALKDTPVESFTKPQPVITGKAVLDGQVMSGREIRIDSVSGKLATEYTPSSTIKIITTGEIHDILYYVNKDDPRGPQPNNPSDDPQYSAWEAGVRAWAIKQGLSPDGIGAIPTEYDDVHLSNDQPTLNIISPGDNSTIKNPSMTVSISGSAKRTISKTEYYIDNTLVSSESGLNQEKNLDLSDWESGWHTLTVSIKDDLQNTASKSIDFNLVISGYIPTINFLSPTDNSTIKKFPIAIKGELTNLQKIKQIDLFYRPATGTAETLIGSINPTTDTFNYSWKKSPGPGDFIITSYIYNFSGKKYTGDQIKIMI
ncbi:MAG: PBP1A family penicillin-binding protein [Candidatus Buchananbacteria bacterium]